MVKNKQIDLSKVPIKKKTFMSFESSWGNIACDEDGNVIEVIGYGEGEVIDAENYLFDIVKFDLVEYGKFCESINITMSEFDDILIVGFWKKDGTYEIRGKTKTGKVREVEVKADGTFVDLE
jgi:hypothetical protein